jgi:hypothetical protein
MIPGIKKNLYATDLSKNASYAFFMLPIWQKNITHALSCYMLSNPLLIRSMKSVALQR